MHLDQRRRVLSAGCCLSDPQDGSERRHSKWVGPFTPATCVEMSKRRHTKMDRTVNLYDGSER